MARLVFCALALLAAGGLATPLTKVHPYKVEDPTFGKRQLEILQLVWNIHEPTFVKAINEAANWDIEKNIEHYNNVTAVKIFGQIRDYGFLPRGVPFSIHDQTQRYLAENLFHVLYSAKDWDTFLKTASYFRNHVNEYMFVYVLYVTILHRPDTQGIVFPPLYEIFPSFFNNGEIMTTAQRINTHGMQLIENYPSTFVWNDNVVIRWNSTVWPYFSEDVKLTYFTHDHTWNTFYYNFHAAYPFWLGGETIPLVKDKRGETFISVHKNILARYYMERLSNDLGEIPELGLDIVKQGFTSGLVYPSGIPFPVRPSYYHLDQPRFVDDILKITDYERRLRDAIERGYYINDAGEHISLRTPESIDDIGRLIEANVDSPNANYYRDFISIWKSVLGGSVLSDHTYYNHRIPLVLPSALEHYQTALRDPAFYMIAKRVLSLYTLWQEQLPLYKHEELAFPSVDIEKVEVDKLVTYFEYSYMNVSNHLHMNEEQRKTGVRDFGVLVQRPVLNHKDFEVRVHVKSSVAKTVVVKFFMAPKYDSYGYEIPLNENTNNFLQFDVFTYDLPAGETVIRRKASENKILTDDWFSSYDVALEAMKCVKENSQFVLDKNQRILSAPRRFILPKGRVGGMPFVLLVYISEYRAPKVPYGTGFNPDISLGLGSGATRLTDVPYEFPLDRPLHLWQIKDVPNIFIEDVTVYHKPTPTIDIPYTY